MGEGQQFSALDQLRALFGLGDNGETGTGTVPTALNTSGGWTPPGGVSGGAGAGTSLGFNTQTGQLAFGGLGALASLWGAQQSSKLANQQFKFTKDTTNTNLNNQIKSYNTALEDKISSRAAMQGNDSAYVNDYLAKNRLTR